MPGVTVQVKGTTNGTITNLDGQYTIQTKMNDILVFSTIGMKTVERKVSSNSPINISMSEDNVQLDQVVVIGYGTVKKSHLSGDNRISGHRMCMNMKDAIIYLPLSAIQE